MTSDEEVLFDAVEMTLLLHAEGWLGDSEALDAIKTVYVELRGPQALEPDNEEVDCD